MRNHIATNVVLPVEQKRRLEELARVTRITQSEYLREAVRDLLDKYERVLNDRQAKTADTTKRKARAAKGARME